MKNSKTSAAVLSVEKLKKAPNWQKKKKTWQLAVSPDILSKHIVHKLPGTPFLVFFWL